MQKPITQQDTFGCGIACTAFTCKMTYEQAKKLFPKPAKTRTFGFICREITGALAKAGKNYDYKYLKRNMRWKEGIIVFVKRSKRYPAGHYLVRTSNSWMDPWKNFRETKGDLVMARAGFRRRLPGRPIYAICPVKR